MDITHVCVAFLGTGEKYRNFNAFFPNISLLLNNQKSGGWRWHIILSPCTTYNQSWQKAETVSDMHVHVKDVHKPLILVHSVPRSSLSAAEIYC